MFMKKVELVLRQPKTTKIPICLGCKYRADRIMKSGEVLHKLESTIQRTVASTPALATLSSQYTRAFRWRKKSVIALTTDVLREIA